MNERMNPNREPWGP